MKSYIYNHDLLFPKKGEHEKCKPGVLKCINVKYVGTNNFMGSGTWEFQLEGLGDRVYNTHYKWSLIEDTEVNVDLMKRIRGLQAKVRAIHREVDVLYREVQDVSVNPEITPRGE